MKTLSTFYQGKKVLITGNTGFKGAWLSQLLLSFGASVSGLALEPNTEPNLFSTLGLRETCKTHIGDIRDPKIVEQAIDEEEPEIIFHLAAQPLVRDSYDNPRYTFETNLLGTLNVLEAVRRKDFVKAVVIITTDKVYKNKEAEEGYTEKEELGGYDPYSASKVCVEFIAESYKNAFFNPERNPSCLICTARAGNVIGGGDWSKDRLIPDIIKSVFETKDKTIIRSPKAIRPWQHVLEPLSGYLLLGKRLWKGDKTTVGAWNFAPERENMITVEKLLKKGIDILGQGSYIVNEATQDKKHETTILRLDATKAKEALSWKPNLSIDKTLQLTFSWYKTFYTDREMIKQETMQQITSFFGEKGP
ncbi:MAG: CDP-glucose 4,6-dehydratase [DPANN group archaeon]|nr:CDP-glucose 4,6-dehydratase [DPANN group archaeon]